MESGRVDLYPRYNNKDILTNWLRQKKIKIKPEPISPHSSGDDRPRFGPIMLMAPIPSLEIINAVKNEA